MGSSPSELSRHRRSRRRAVSAEPPVLVPLDAVVPAAAGADAGVTSSCFALTVLDHDTPAALHYASFIVGFSQQSHRRSRSGIADAARAVVQRVDPRDPRLPRTRALLRVPLLRRRRVAPYFLPMPFLLTGTLGAFIRIRRRFPSKRALFDIGIAGPIAGFLVARPVLC